MTISYLSFFNFETLWAFGNTGYRTAVSGSWLVSKKVKSINQHVGRFKSPQSRKPVPFFMIRPMVPFQILYGFHYILSSAYYPSSLATGFVRDTIKKYSTDSMQLQRQQKRLCFRCNSHLPYMDVKTCPLLQCRMRVGGIKS